jgi:GntR family transcriptional regulator, rspAB operon transcriptional repressor
MTRPELATELRPRTGLNLTSPEMVYERFLAMILNLELPPGALAGQRTLIQSLRTNRAAFREALHRLRETGLITVLPRAGIAISDVTFVDVQNVLEARFALEVYVVRLAAQRATASDFDRLRTLARMSEATSTDTATGPSRHHLGVELDRQLHSEIARVSRNEILARALDNVLLLNARIENLVFNRNGRRSRFAVSHLDIIRHITEHDLAGAEDAMNKHLQEAREVLRQAFDLRSHHDRLKGGAAGPGKHGAGGG